MVDKFDKIENEVKAAIGPDTVQQRLAKEFDRIGLRNIPELPQNMQEAIKYWLLMNEPPERYEAPKQLPVQGRQDAMRWECPYHDRLVYTLRAFHRLSSPHRQIVMAGVLGEQVPWRGDEVDFYLTVIDEHKKMLKMGVAAYRVAAMKQMKACLAKMQKRNDAFMGKNR